MHMLAPVFTCYITISTSTCISLSLQYLLALVFTCDIISTSTCVALVTVITARFLTILLLTIFAKTSQFSVLYTVYTALANDACTQLYVKVNFYL